MYHVQTIDCCYMCAYFKEAKMKQGKSLGHGCAQDVMFPVHIFGMCDKYKKMDWMPTLRLFFEAKEGK